MVSPPPPPHVTLKFDDNDDESIQGEGHLFSFNDGPQVRKSESKYTWISENGPFSKVANPGNTNWLPSSGLAGEGSRGGSQVPLHLANDIIQQQQNAYNNLMFHQQQFPFPNYLSSSVNSSNVTGLSAMPGSSFPLGNHYIGVKQSHSLGKKCSNCMTAQTPSWRRCPEGKALLCNACGLYHKLHGKSRPFVVQEDGIIRIERTTSFKRDN